MKRKKQCIINLLVAGYLLAPLLVFSQAVTDIDSLIARLGDILNLVIPLLIGLAFVVFLWGVYKYIYSASVEAKESARSLIIYGLIGLFVMLTAWGLVNILITTFFGAGGPGVVPPFPLPEVPTII